MHLRNGVEVPGASLWARFAPCLLERPCIRRWWVLGGLWSCCVWGRVWETNSHTLSRTSAMEWLLKGTEPAGPEFKSKCHKVTGVSQRNHPSILPDLGEGHLRHSHTHISGFCHSQCSRNPNNVSFAQSCLEGLCSEFRVLGCIF